jgi:hypothetical protein
MPETIAIGPLLMNGSVLARIAAGIGAWLIVRRWANKHGYGAVSEILGNLFFIVVIFWRFGWIIFDPSVIREAPQTLLVMSGSTREVWIGLIVGSVYAANASRRRGIPRRVWLDAGVLAGLCYAAIQSALDVEYGRVTSMPWGLRPAIDGFRYHPVHLYRAALLAAAIFWLLRRPWRPGFGHYAAGGVLYYGVAVLAVSFFDREAPLLFMLTYDQIIAVTAILIGYAWSSRRILNKEGSERAVHESTLNSKAQQRQAKQNEQRAKQEKDSIIDKKLDGPNRPAE